MLASLFLARPVKRLERASTADDVRHAGKLLRIRLATLEYTWRELFYSPRAPDRDLAQRIAGRLTGLLATVLADANDAATSSDRLHGVILELADSLQIPVIRLDDTVVATTAGYIRDYRQWGVRADNGRRATLRTQADMLACLLARESITLTASLPAIWITPRPLPAIRVTPSSASLTKAHFLTDGGISIRVGEASRIIFRDGVIRITRAAITARWPSFLQDDTADSEHFALVMADISISKKLRVTQFETPPAA